MWCLHMLVFCIHGADRVSILEGALSFSLAERLSPTLDHRLFQRVL